MTSDLLPAGLLRDGLKVGAVGTATMLCALGFLTEVVPDRAFPPDYEVADAPTQAMATVLHRHPSNAWEYAAWRAALRWGYGSAFGVVRVGLGRRGVREPVASLLYFAMLQGMAATLYPTLAKTPPIWRWRRLVLVGDLASHAAYVLGAGWAARRLVGEG